MKNLKFKVLFGIGIAAALIGALLFYGYAQTSDASGATIVVRPQSYDFGEVVYGDVASHEFTISNTGSETLEILRLSTSCGCTSAKVEEKDKVIQPGESVPMEVRFDPAVHKDNTDVGTVTRIVYIRSNDVKNPETEVTITANVVREASSGFKPLVMTQSGIDVEIGSIRSSNAETVLELAFNNHRYDLSQMDVLKLSDWGGQKPTTYEVVNSTMGGHHVSAELTFAGSPSGALQIGLNDDLVFNFVLP